MFILIILMAASNIMATTTNAAGSAVRSVQRLADGVAPWTTVDPFLFCVFHNDMYPSGNAAMAPDPKLLRGRNIGSDFEGKDGWRMYHGDVWPGFPKHPHRGFETITIVKHGFIDHFDSLGASGRIGPGDVQWMTAGAGIQHSEMFPLLRSDAPNPMELFQIWLNLPKASKMAKPHFTMFWKEDIPVSVTTDPTTGAKAHITVIAGSYEGTHALTPPPESFATNPDSVITILILQFESGSSLTLPPIAPSATGTIARTLYFFEGKGLRVDGKEIPHYAAISLDERKACTVAATQPSRCLMLQGRNINEPVAQHGPFVMNTNAEIQQAFEDYRRTQFGGWPHGSDGPVLARDVGRSATLPDGSVIFPPSAKKQEEL